MKLYMIFYVLNILKIIFCQDEDDSDYCSPKTSYGENCTIPCPSNCLNQECFKKNGTCFSCEDGKYYGDNCESECNENRPYCESCNKNDGECNKCINNAYWDKDCKTPCLFCNGGCNITNGICTNSESCIDNQHYGDNCESECSENRPFCESCNKNDGKCNKCINDTYWDKDCKTPCLFCNGGCNITNGICINTEKCKDDEHYGEQCEIRCDENRTNCEKCYKNDGICSKCSNDSFWDKDCSTSCFNCIDGCNITDGTCLNTEKCKDDEYYGEQCEIRCDENRTNCEKCNKNDGICKKCINNTYWDKDCKTPCLNCYNGCNNENGICLDKDKCKDEKHYGEKCEDICDKNRPNCEKCNKKDGKCTKCINDTYWNDNCSESTNCPSECQVDGTCFNQEENCIDPSFYGEKCNTPCSNINKNCSTCNRNNGTCISCLDNKSYGKICNYTCENCKEGKCYTNGICLNQDECETDFYYGEKCQEKCDFCSEDGCFINKKCKNGCSSKFYNPPDCELKCADNCFNETCDDNGICLGCEDKHYHGNFCNESIGGEIINCENVTQNGSYCYACKYGTHYGDTCQKECSKGCKDTYKETGEKICRKDGGYCVGCESDYFGSRCDEICYGCQGGCDDQGYCNEFKCKEGMYGLKCNESCKCEINSKNMECGKFSGECSNCTFGYFGENCKKQCNYKCKNNLCCIFKDKKLKQNNSIKTDYKSLNISFNGQKYTVEIDYNYGYPLSLFSSVKYCQTNIKLNEFNMDSLGEKIVHNINFTNYQMTANLYKNAKFTIYGEKDKEIELKNIDIAIAENVVCRNSSNIIENSEGVIGLGFFNTISNSLFSNNSIEQNILSYSVNYKKNTVELIFGSMSNKQYDYIEKLTSCDVLFKNDTEIQGKTMTCKLDGIKSSKHSSGLRLNDATITFSIGENSSFLLNNDKNYIKYIKDVYFIENVKEEKDSITNHIFFRYPKKKINKLPNFGFVFNKFYYSYEPNLFFSKDVDEEGKKRFLIEFSDNSDSEFILGREFLKDITFTINNEEAEIYFYAKNAQYSDNLKVNPSSSNFRIQLEARETAAIFLSVIVFINIVIFVIYYFIKKKKMNSSDYIKID